MKFIFRRRFIYRVSSILSKKALIILLQKIDKLTHNSNSHGAIDCMAGETEQYIYTIGIQPEAPIRLDEFAVFESTECQPNEDVVKSMTFDKGCSLYDFGIAASHLWLVDGQVKIEDSNPANLAEKTWNSLTPLFYLSGLVDADILAPLQSSVPANKLTPSGRLHAINSANLCLPSKVVSLTKEQCITCEEQLAAGLALMENDSFRQAAHALWSCKWIPAPASQMAIIWSGIESLFGIKSELTFRISYEAAVLLDIGLEGYKKIKKLYNERSRAVHSNSQIDNSIVQESAELLRSLVLKCSILGSLPKEEALLFPENR